MQPNLQEIFWRLLPGHDLLEIKQLILDDMFVGNRGDSRDLDIGKNDR